MCRAIHTSTLLNDSVKHKVETAEKKLKDIHTPHRLRFVYYLRLSCSALREIQTLEGCSNSDRCHSRPYSELIKLLTEYDRDWWKKCYVNQFGVLDSDDSVIHPLLKPILELHHLVQLLNVTYPTTPNLVFMNTYSKVAPQGARLTVK